MKHTVTLNFFDHSPDEETISQELLRLSRLVQEGYVCGEIHVVDPTGAQHRGWWSHDIQDSGKKE